MTSRWLHGPSCDVTPVTPDTRLRVWSRVLRSLTCGNSEQRQRYVRFCLHLTLAVPGITYAVSGKSYHQSRLNKRLIA